jgi:fumarate reductase subunit C
MTEAREQREFELETWWFRSSSYLLRVSRDMTALYIGSIIIIIMTHNRSYIAGQQSLSLFRRASILSSMLSMRLF